MRRFVWYACGMPRLVSGGIPEAILSYGGRSLQMETGTGIVFHPFVPVGQRAAYMVPVRLHSYLLWLSLASMLSVACGTIFEVPLFRNQFARFAAYSVGLVLDTHESRFEMLYEFELSLGEPARLLFSRG